MIWVEEFYEFFNFRSTFFVTFVFLTFIGLAPASKDFKAFRLQQFELHGNSYGSTGSLLNLETRILPGSPIISSPRRCYVVKLIDLSIDMYRNLLKHSVAGILIIVPSSDELQGFTTEQRAQIQELESVMLFEQATIPIYFVLEDPDVREMYNTVKKSADSLSTQSSGLQTLLQHVHGNGVQLVSSLGTPKAMTDSYIHNIQGSLIGSKINKQFPILISAHYDSLSPAAELSFGADSNGSGSAVLLELARLFSHLYSQRGGSNVPRRAGGRPHNSLLFLLSGAGQFNYQGTQKYLEDQIETSDHSDLQDVRLVVCLDALGGNKDKLYIHVSRSIKEGTMLNSFINNLKKAADQLYPEVGVQVIQRKVRTESLLTWEHEKYHLKKLNSITLSSHESSNLVKSSLLDTKSSVDIVDLTKKTHIISEALAETLYNVSSGSAFSDEPILNDSKESLQSLIDYVTSEPRSAQLMAGKNSRTVGSLKSILSRFTHESTLYTSKIEKRDANLVFYDQTSGIITAYEVKPAVFDLVLSIAIAAYIGLVYLLVKNFPKFYENLSYSVHSTHSSNGNGASMQKSKVQ